MAAFLIPKVRSDAHPEPLPISSKRSKAVMPAVIELLENIQYELAKDEQMELVAVLQLLIEDCQIRMEMGLKKYGVALETFNGRNALRDEYQEQFDTVQYSVQQMLEVKERLVGCQYEPLPFSAVIAFCGVRGVGKTTLAEGIKKIAELDYEDLIEGEVVSVEIARLMSEKFLNRFHIEALPQHIDNFLLHYGLCKSKSGDLYRKAACGIGALIRECIGEDALLQEVCDRAERKHAPHQDILLLHNIRGNDEVEALYNRYADKLILINVESSVRGYAENKSDDVAVKKIDGTPVTNTDLIAFTIQNNGTKYDAVLQTLVQLAETRFEELFGKTI